MNILDFPKQSHVEIDGGTIQSQTVTDHKGTRALLTNIGAFHFFVDVVEADGTRVGMWDGKSYSEATRQAQILSADFGPIRDLVKGARI